MNQWTAYKKGRKTWGFGRSGGPTIFELRLVEGTTEDADNRAIGEAVIAGLNAADRA